MTNLTKDDVKNSLTSILQARNLDQTLINTLLSDNFINGAYEYGVERLEGEKDDRLRMRGQMALDGFSTAGPIDAYKFFALDD